MGEIIEEVKSRGVMIAVGGPMATVEPEQLEDLADVLFVGEADETWPQFLRDWENGTPPRCSWSRTAGLSTSSTFDLLRPSVAYLSSGLGRDAPLRPR